MQHYPQTYFGLSKVLQSTTLLHGWKQTRVCSWNAKSNFLRSSYSLEQLGQFSDSNVCVVMIHEEMIGHLFLKGNFDTLAVFRNL